MIVDFAVEQQRNRQLELIEQFEQPPDTDPVAVFAPTPVVRVGVGKARRIGNAQAFPVSEVLEIEGNMYRQASFLRPCERRAVRDRTVGKSTV